MTLIEAVFSALGPSVDDPSAVLSLVSSCQAAGLLRYLDGSVVLADPGVPLACGSGPPAACGPRWPMGMSRKWPSR